MASRMEACESPNVLAQRLSTIFSPRFRAPLTISARNATSAPQSRKRLRTGCVDDEDVYGAEGFVHLLHQARDFAFIANICRKRPSMTATLPDCCASLFSRISSVEVVDSHVRARACQFESHRPAESARSPSDERCPFFLGCIQHSSCELGGLLPEIMLHLR